jgi:hypothetical protein
VVARPLDPVDKPVDNEWTDGGRTDHFWGLRRNPEDNPGDFKKGLDPLLPEGARCSHSVETTVEHEKNLGERATGNRSDHNDVRTGGIPEKRLRLGTKSVGFSLGFVRRHQMKSTSSA